MALRHLSLAFAALVLAASAQAAAPPSREARVAAIIARHAASPPMLRVLLQPMPKGGDLHNHLDGSVYAEDYLRWASDDGDCIARTTRTITPPPCAADQVPAKDLVSRDPKFYQETIDALSMRNWYPGSGTGETSGHDHTFATFRRFAAVAQHSLGGMLAVTREQASSDNVAYMEQIADPGAAFAPQLLDQAYDFSFDDFEADYANVAPLLPALVTSARAEFDRAENNSDTGGALFIANPRHHDVSVHYLFFVLRTLPPRQVFAQIALGYALAAADPRFVGLNLVAPEDDPVALHDFELQMRMFRFFAARQPGVKLSLHAGELALGLVSPSELGFHIRDTVEIAGARRIGHGYSIPYETDAAALLAEMAAKKIAVEINLTSNAITPGIAGAEHPLALYRAAGVPVTLSADDEGVFRIDLTHEYVRAVTEQKLGYADLKQIARNGLEYSFLPGTSLWRGGDYRKPTPACGGQTPGGATPAPSCAAFLAASEKARLQWRFEADIAAYEDAVLAGRILKLP
jgi:adenosine deaminase